MPQGVAHFYGSGPPMRALWMVRIPLMPQGVEHNFLPKQILLDQK